MVPRLGAAELWDVKLLSSPCFLTLPKTVDERAAYVPASNSMSSSIHTSSSSGPSVQLPQAPPLNAASAHTTPPSQATNSAQTPANISRPYSPQNQPAANTPTNSQTAYQWQPQHLSGAGNSVPVAQIPQQQPQNLPNTTISRQEADLQPWR